jgi:hypothetical protein
VNFPSFLSGFLQCMHCVDLVTARSAEGEAPYTYTIDWVHRTLLDRAKPYFVDYLKNSQGTEQMVKWLRYMEAVEHMFDSNSPKDGEIAQPT